VIPVIALQNRRAHDCATTDASFLRTSFLRQIFKSSFLPKLTAKGKEYCKMGQNLELPFAQKLLQQSKEGLTLFQIENVYRVGLVEKNEMSKDFHTYIGSSHEAVQLLHQAYVYSFQYVLLLVGDASGNIIRGACTK
jgi:hypothetical protein